MKTCTYCKETKPLTEFYNDGREGQPGRDGKTAWCKECNRTKTTHQNMRRRCNDPENDHYPAYGGRGIAVCERWNSSSVGFRNFLEDMGFKPEGRQLDRIDNDGNYEPSNCRWVEPFENHLNRGNQTEPIGVRKCTSSRNYQALIMYKRVQYVLGSSFNTPVEAAKAYDDACEKFKGKRPNQERGIY